MSRWLAWLAGMLWAFPPAAPQGQLLVLHKAAGSLGFYSPEGKLLAEVAVGRHPHEMVVSPDGRLVYITDNGTMRIEDPGPGGNTISIVDLEARKKVGEIPLGEYHRPHGIDWDRATGRLLVSCEAPDRLLVVDPIARSVLKAYETQGKTAHMVAAGAGGRYAYVSNAGSHTIAVIELAGGRVRLIPTGERPEGSVRSPDGRRIYVVNREAQRIAVVDAENNRAAGEISVGRGPVRVGITPDGKTLVYALMHDEAVEFADAASGRVLGRVKLAGRPVSLSLSPDGRRAYAAAQDQDTVYVISVADRKLLRSFKTAPGAGPDPVLELPGP